MSALRVFVVDDDVAFRDTLSKALRAAGHDVLEASGGTAALRRLRALPQCPDVLLTELSMPDGDGIELITAVRRLAPAMRVLAFSGKRHVAGLDLFNLAAMLGAETTFEKPVGVDEIVRAAAAATVAEGAHAS